MASMEQSVMTRGVYLMPEWCVDSWDYHGKVRDRINGSDILNMEIIYNPCQQALHTIRLHILGKAAMTYF